MLKEENINKANFKITEVSVDPKDSVEGFGDFGDFESPTNQDL